MVSFIEEYGKERINPNQWTTSIWNEYQEILKQLQKLDEKLNQHHCEDSAKVFWMLDVEKRLKALENKTKRKGK
jgi:phage terminase large subunit GpA-like protein